MFPRLPDKKEAARQSLEIARMILASNPFNRIEDREADLRRTLKTR